MDLAVSLARKPLDMCHFMKPAHQGPSSSENSRRSGNWRRHHSGSPPRNSGTDPVGPRFAALSPAIGVRTPAEPTTFQRTVTAECNLRPGCRTISDYVLAFRFPCLPCGFNGPLTLDRGSLLSRGYLNSLFDTSHSRGVFPS